MGKTVWQRGYHDHIIRSEADYLRIWDYIDTNPAKWREDCYYCQAEGGDLIVKHTYLFRPGRWRAATWGRPYNAPETCPLIRRDLRSCHLPPKRLTGDRKGRPYGGNRTGSVGSAKPGAPTEPHQRQFLQTQGPVARWEFSVSLRFCAPEMPCPAQGVTPVMGDRG